MTSWTECVVLVMIPLIRKKEKQQFFPSYSHRRQVKQYDAYHCNRHLVR